jgi:hypothetical protein
VAIVIWAKSDTTSWLKTHRRYQRHVSIGEPLPKKDDSEAWMTTKAACIHQTREIVHYLAG